jgi:hypothetical protein
MILLSGISFMASLLSSNFFFFSGAPGIIKIIGIVLTVIPFLFFLKMEDNNHGTNDNVYGTIIGNMIVAMCIGGIFITSAYFIQQLLFLYIL